MWKGNLPVDQCGILILGSPIGTEAFVKRELDKKLHEEVEFLDRIALIPNIQVSWLLMYYCGSPRATYLLRTTPPTLCQDYANKRDAMIRKKLAKILNLTETSLDRKAGQIHLPGRLGGLGLNSSERSSPSAYWGSWADVLPILQQRLPGLIAQIKPIFIQLAISNESIHSHTALRNLHQAALLLNNEGFSNLPSWEDLMQGYNPSEPDTDDESDNEPGQRRKGWQRIASHTREKHFHVNFISQLGNGDKARLRSCSGPNAARWLYTIPCEKAFRLTSPEFRCALSRRLGLPIEAVADVCEGCGHVLDEFGWHRSTCMRTGRVQTRHKPLIYVWQRVFREAGIPIPDRNRERMLCTTHINRGEHDARRMDLITSGIDGVFQGSPLFMDITIISPLHGNGRAMPNSSRIDGAACIRADVRNREDDYPDVHQADSAQLLCLASETYGRWGDHCITLVRQLARFKAKNYPEYLQASVVNKSLSRWWGMLAISLQRIVIDSIISLTGG